MLIFREDLYGLNILTKNKYQTERNHGFERCVLVRYMHDNGYSKDEILSSLNKLTRNEFAYLPREKKDKIYERIYKKALEFEYIKDREVIIYKDELDKILEIKDQRVRDLLFVCLVYYKWGQTVDSYKFYSHNLNRILVKENDKNLLSLAKLNSLRAKQKNLLFYQLISNGYYKNTGFKNNNYFYIPFCQDAGEVAFKIDNFDNLIFWLYSYLEPNKYKKCEECGKWIYKTTGSKKYCKPCALYVSNQQKMREKYERAQRLINKGF